MNLSDYPKEIKTIEVYASRIWKRSTRDTRVHIDYQDLYQAGLIGLWKAIQKYNGKNGCSLSTYASIRIRGEMIDTIRKYCPLSKEMIKKKFIVSFVEFKQKHEDVTEFNTDSFDLHRKIDGMKDFKNKAILNKTIEGYYKREIADFFGVQPSVMSGLVKAAINDIRVEYQL